MKIKLLTLFAVLISLTACHTLKETSAQYERMPIKLAKSPSKEGKSCGVYSFPLRLFYSNADISVESARKQGEITEILTIETEISQSLGYRKICTVVKFC